MNIPLKFLFMKIAVCGQVNLFTIILNVLLLLTAYQKKIYSSKLAF